MASPIVSGAFNSSTSDQSAFVAELAAYHEKRGTPFDPEPRVGTRPVNLLQLYNIVIGRGGYDRVSEEKLAWRKLAQDLNLGVNNLPALAFSLKTTYYKYLAAYEISTLHGKEPPPKEILEETTAKGGGLLTRTLENYKPSNRRETGALGNDYSSGEEVIPARDRSEEVSGGRIGLRQAPPQRVLFQPGSQPSRQSRSGPAASHSPASHQPPRGASTSYTPNSNMDSFSSAVANYEPRLQMPLTLRPVITPGNNPVEYARRQKALRDASGSVNRGAVSNSRLMPLPGSGFDGPNIYVRCLCALKSGIPAEQDYALHHLVKISMERGDKYRFEAFSGLAEALIEKLLEVSSLYYKVKWEVAYFDDGQNTNPYTLDGLEGTPDILEKIRELTRLDIDDNFYTGKFSDALLQINEAALTLRNMVMLEDNAAYVSEMYPLRDFLTIALNLPDLDSLVELKHYTLDVAEQLTKYYHLAIDDPLYVSLLTQLESQDRGVILTALRAISRISMNLEENNLLKGVPLSAVQSIIDWTLLDDEELVHACLDFLYQYTAVVDNVDFLLSNIEVGSLVNQLSRLLMYGVRITNKEYNLSREQRLPAPTSIAPLPHELQAQLIKLDEPERSSQWLRCLFEEDRDEVITQIALWQAYQARFTPLIQESGRPLLAAADFIKNVSTTFADKAAAQVQAGPVQKFVIKGIRMRSVPVDLKGDEFRKCMWRSFPGNPTLCGEFFMSPEAMYQHILKAHLGAKPTEDGKFTNVAGKEYICQWDRCHRFKSAPATSLSRIASHIKIHLPPLATVSVRDSIDHLGAVSTRRSKPSYIIAAKKQSFQYQVTAQDERNDAAGIPLSAVLVLRNLARNLTKTEAEENAMKGDEGVSLVEQIFKPVEPRLFEVMAHNKSLWVYMTDLIGAIKDV